jgi:hypothetical protein
MDIKELRVSNERGTKQNHPWEYARSKVIFNILKAYIKKSTRGCVLDVGCGDVFFLTRFADEFPNFELGACDTAFNQELIEKIKLKNDKYSIRFFNDVQNVMNIQEVDIVFLLDVLEHIEDDVRFLRDLIPQPYVTRDTMFVITVPAFNFLYCNHDKWLGHYRRYTQALLKQHIEAAGLSYVSGGYFFTSLLLPRYIQTIIEKFKKTKSFDNQGIGNYTGRKVLSWLYENFLLTDFYIFKIFRLLGIKVPGLSAYMICKVNK